MCKSLLTNFEVLSEKKDLSSLGRTFQHVVTMKKVANLKISQKYETVANSKNLERSMEATITIVIINEIKDCTIFLVKIKCFIYFHIITPKYYAKLIMRIRISTPHWNQIFWVVLFYPDLLNEHSQLTK